MPSHASVITQAAAPAASNTRVGGEKPFAAMLSRVTFRTLSGEQLIWASERGAQTYRRCHPGLGVARAF